MLLGISEEAVGDLLGLGGSECWNIERAQSTVDPQLRRGAGCDMQIAGPVIHHEFQKLVDTRCTLGIVRSSGPVGRGFVHDLSSPHICGTEKDPVTADIYEKSQKSKKRPNHRAWERRPDR